MYLAIAATRAGLFLLFRQLPALPTEWRDKKEQYDPDESVTLDEFVISSVVGLLLAVPLSFVIYLLEPPVQTIGWFRKRHRRKKAIEFFTKRSAYA
jgi:hypothetical protein